MKRVGFLFLIIFNSGIVWSQQERAFVQSILLDKIVDAGSLKLFPGFRTGEEHNYYYLPSKLRISINDETGLPEFSFIRYVENNPTGGDVNKSETDADGGGIVHMLIGLKITDEEKSEALSALKQIDKEGKIIGPVIYRGGTIALISILPEEQSKKAVLGMGKAPILEGDKIAVSILLDKKNSKILWETFKMPTPIVSYNLDMLIGGYNSPVEYTIEMDFDKIYKHKVFEVAATLPIFSGEINNAVQDMKQSGAIKIVAIGESSSLESSFEKAQNKLIDMCFTPLGGAGEGVNWESLGKPMYANGTTSLLDKISQGMNSNEASNSSGGSKSAGSTSGSQGGGNSPAKPTTSGVTKQTVKTPAPGLAKPDNTHATNDSLVTAKKDTTTKTGSNNPPVNDNSLSQSTPAQPKSSPPKQTSNAGGGQSTLAQTAGEVAKTGAAIASTVASATPVGAAINILKNTKISAVYQQKEIRYQGKFSYSAKQYFTTSLPEEFGGNIGKINCRECFKEINLYDPMYKQREIPVFIDGDSKDFDSYINFVTVNIRKKHGLNGEITTDDIRIDRINFSSMGNRFRLMYGWMPGDNNRKEWLKYDMKVTWSFFGGGNIEEDWKPVSSAALNLAPPMKKRIINIAGDAERFKAIDARSIDVRLFYNLGGEEQLKQVTLIPSKNIASADVEFAQVKNIPDYSYEITWLLNDNTTVESGRKTAKGNVLYVDALPKK